MQPRASKRKLSVEDVCSDEPGETLGQRLAARARKRRKSIHADAFETLWPKMLALLQETADKGKTSLRVGWEELGVVVDDDVDNITEFPVFRMLEKRLKGTGVEVDASDFDPLELTFA